MSGPGTSSSRGGWRFPLYAQILGALVLGALLGGIFGDRPFIPGLAFGNAQLAELSMLVTTLLKTLASPLIFFAVLDAFLRSNITWERGRKLLMFSLINVSAAMLIGLLVLNWWHPGERWQAELARVTQGASSEATAGQIQGAVSAAGGGNAPASLTVVESLERMVPTSVVQPLIDGNLMGLILLAVLIGAGCRSVRTHQAASGVTSSRAFEEVVETIYEILLRLLEWVVQIVPLAVLGAVAKAVSETGAEVFQLVAIFLVTMLAGLSIHAFGYYSLAVWLWGRRSPREYLTHAVEPFFTALSTNSSLATVPVTLRTLTGKLGVSDQSARLSACVGTNFNNDGITLYEAMTAIFLAQAAGLNLTLAAQVKTVAICVLVSLGAAGIPHGGLAVLPLVLASTGLSPALIQAALPLILTVDWIIARYRSCVNVMGDMAVAIQLDGSTNCPSVSVESGASTTVSPDSSPSSTSTS